MRFKEKSFDVPVNNEANDDIRLNELKARKAHITRQIGQVFVDKHLDRDMTGTEYEELFARLHETNEEINSLTEAAAFMKCPHCGRSIRKGGTFCPKCGRRLTAAEAGLAEEKAEDEKHENSLIESMKENLSQLAARKIESEPEPEPEVDQNLIPNKDPFVDAAPANGMDRIFIVGIVSGLIVAVFAIILILGLIRDKNDDVADVVMPTTVIDQSKDTGSEGIDKAESTDADSQIAATAVDRSKEFEISTESTADYGAEQVLAYAQYNKYDPGMGLFKFSYPARLYNKVSVIENADGGVYGKVLQKVIMEASDGSTATFTVYQNEIGSSENGSNSDAADYVLQYEKSHYFTPIMQVNGASGDGTNSTFSFFAYKDGNMGADCVFDLCQITADNVYNMTLTYPRPSGGNDDRNKAYYVDTMYTLCGFNGSTRTTPYSFKDFVEKNYTNFELTDTQKEILWGIAELNVYDPPAEAEQSDRYVTTGSRSEIAASISTNRMMLDWYNSAGLQKDISLFEKENVGDKVLLNGCLDYARTFYRDVFSVEMNTDVLMQDGNTDMLPVKPTLLYSKDRNEIVSIYSNVVFPGGDGPDDYDYNKDLQCFDYHMGPVYGMTAEGETWQTHRDNKEAGYGIYVAHIRPYMNNSVGFEFMGIDRVE